MADIFDDTEGGDFGDDGGYADAGPENAPGAIDDEVEEQLMLSLKKKKKKKKKKVVEEDVTESATPWIGSDRDYSYTEMLDRVFSLLRERNPGIDQKKRHTMPPPSISRVGTRKTMWGNFEPICKVMHRQTEHLMAFVLAELGTEGSVDGSKRLILKGRYVQKQIESILKKYIMEYVTCHMCRTPETLLTRDSVTRLFFLDCEQCGSRRSVAPIKSGFHATSRSDRRAAKQAK